MNSTQKTIQHNSTQTKSQLFFPRAAHLYCSRHHLEELPLHTSQVFTEARIGRLRRDPEELPLDTSQVDTFCFFLELCACWRETAVDCEYDDWGDMDEMVAFWSFFEEFQGSG